MTYDEARAILENLAFQRENSAVVALDLRDCLAIRTVLAPREVFLVRQHLNVGDEVIIAASLDASKAGEWANQRCEATCTANFDVVRMVEGPPGMY